MKPRFLLIAILVLSALGCKKYVAPIAPSNVDFTISLNDAAYAPLRNNGSSAAKDGVMIVKDPSGKYYAVQQSCTYSQCNLEYLSSYNTLQCPCSGCQFDLYGFVLQGPARASLKSYQTKLTGNSLRVFSQ